MRLSFIRGAATVCICLLTGCDGNPEVRSKGTLDTDVLSIWSEAPLWAAGEEWHLDSVPRITIGDESDEAHQLSRVFRAFRVPEGYMVINGNPPGVRIYGKSGEHLRTLGRRGEGPGEFRSIFAAWRGGGDTLIVYDPALRRITYLSPSGSLLTTRYYQRETSEGGIRDILLGRFMDGSFLALPNTSPRPAEGEGLVELETYVMRVSADFLTVDTITRSTGGRRFLFDQRDGYQDWRSQPFTPLTAVRAGPQSVFVSNTEDFWIEEFGLDGELIRRFGRAHTPASVTKEDWDELREGRIATLLDNLERQGSAAGIEEEDGIRDIERFFRIMPKPDTKPAHSRELILDGGGHLWVRELTDPTDGRPRWSVFDPEGQFLGRVTGFEDLRVTEIGDDYVLGVWTDNLDVQSVREFGLVKAGAG